MTEFYPNLRALFLFALTLAPFSSQATVIQILHTNDLHASLRTTGAPKPGEDEFGGWAQVKAKMDELTAQAQAQGMETLRVDAGDYTEGTMYYFPDSGLNVLKTFQDMGYEATTMGNHDWLMGARGMDALYGKSPFRFPVLSANLKLRSNLQNLTKQIIPTTSITKAGIKIGIMGLSTDEALYSWIPAVGSRKNEFKLKSFDDDTYEDEDDDGNPVQKIDPGLANETIAHLRRKNDVVIALTHIGVGSDKVLAAESKGLDLIIGGHSHTVIDSMNLIPDRDGREILVAQTGFNGHYIGKILLEVLPGREPKVLSYELVPVLNNGPKDPVITADLAKAESALENQYGTRLNEAIGTSEVRLVSGDSGPTAYAKFAVDAFRDMAQTDIAIDVGSFHGNTPQPAGTVTRLNLMQMYPRKFEDAQNEGLYIYAADVPGILLSVGLKYAVKFGMFLSTSGITYDVNKLSDAAYAKLKEQYLGTSDYDSVTPFYPVNIRVHGQPIRALHWYSIAAPESLVRGAFGITPLVGLVIRHSHAIPHTIWDALNFYLLKIGTIKRLNNSESHFTTREYSNGYQRRYGMHRHDPEQFTTPNDGTIATPAASPAPVSEVEPAHAPEVDQEDGSLHTFLQEGLQEIFSDPEGRSLNPDAQTE